jgi:phosphate transport system substrate-binding protein
MTLFRNLTMALLCSAAPQALTAQAVELRSADDFISIEGEIIGFNGTMLRVATRLGQVSVPAAEVICYGPACTTLLETNPFDLTADQLAGVVADLTPPAPPSIAPAAPAPVTLDDTMSLAFASGGYSGLYRSLTGSFALASDTTSRVELTAQGQVRIASGDGRENLAIDLVDAAADADLVLLTTALAGRGPAVYASPDQWSGDGQLSHQMVGLRAFAVVTTVDLGASGISVADLAAIYAGEITNWSQLGGPDLPVMPLQLPVGSALRNEFVATVMDPAGKTISAETLTMADEAAIAAAIADIPGSISVLELQAAGAVPVLPVAGVCGLAVKPTVYNVISGDYPLIRPVMLRYERQPQTTLVSELFDFATASVVQDLLARDGFIKQTAQSQSEKYARLNALLSTTLDPVERPVAASMFQALFDGERLSPTFIGGPVSGPEGGWNRAMMISLAKQLSTPAFAGREVIFAGIAQAEDGPQAAIDASAAVAADMVAAFQRFAPAVIASNGLTLTPMGFGAVSRVSCLEGQVDKPVNSRVEIWVK